MAVMDIAVRKSRSKAFRITDLHWLRILFSRHCRSRIRCPTLWGGMSLSVGHFSDHIRGNSRQCCHCNAARPLFR